MPVQSVLHLITNADLGGAQLHLAHLVEDQAKRFAVTCLVGELGPACAEFEARGASVVVLEHLRRKMAPVSDLRAVNEVRRHISRLRPDVLHAHSSKAGMVARMAALRGLDCRVVYTVHGWGFKRGVPFPRRQIVWAAEKLMTSRADAYICVSRFDFVMGRRMLALEPERSFHIPNGIPDVPFQFQERERNRIVMVGRFQEPKRQDIVIRAVALLPREVSATFIGSGPGLDAMKRLAQVIGVADRVTFLGDRRDVVQLLAAHEIGVLVSDYEGMPLSVLEYMRAGLAIIASRVGGVSELIRDNRSGVLLRRNEPHELADALVSLRSDLSRSNLLARQGRLRFEERHSSQTMAARVRGVYERVVSNGRCFVG